MTEPITPGSPESLARHLTWLYGPNGVYPGNVPCKCEYGYTSSGRLYGLNMGLSWARTTTHPYCPHHGDKAEKARRERARLYLRGHHAQ